MLQVKQLNLKHQKDNRLLINQLTFSINSGEKVAIIGEEGNGKSTLLKYLYQPSLVSDYMLAKGQYTKQFVRPYYIPQQLEQTDLLQSLDTFFFAPEWVETLDYGRLYEVANTLHFASERLTSPQLLQELSGGERIKVQFIRALAYEPDILFLDEPSNDLDLATLEWLTRYLQESSLTVIYISHDEQLLEDTATRLIHLEQLHQKREPRTTFSKEDYRHYMTDRQKTFDKQNDLFVNEQREAKKQREHLKRIEDKVHHAQNKAVRDPVAGRLLKKKMRNIKAMGRRLDRQDEQATVRPIQEESITVKFSHVTPFPNSKTILNFDQAAWHLPKQNTTIDLNLTLKGQDKIVIVGANGIGKTTLLRYIYHLLCDKFPQQVGYMPQHYTDCLAMTQTPINWLQQTYAIDEKTQLMTYLGSLKFTPNEMMQPISALSGGQQAKLIMAELDINGYPILLLDEPTRNISPLSQAHVRDAFSHYPGCLIAISHDRKFIDTVAHHVYQLDTKELKQLF